MDKGPTEIMDYDNARREIDLIKESLESFIEDCKLFNSSIDDSTAKAELLQTRFNGTLLSFDDVYPILTQIPNALMACKLQLSMEMLLDNARRVYKSEVDPTIQRSQAIKKYQTTLPHQTTDYTKRRVEADDDGAHVYSEWAHARSFLDVSAFSGDISETHTSQSTYDRTSLNTGLQYSFVFPDTKSKRAGPLHDTMSKLDEEYKACKTETEVGQDSETRFKAQQKLDAFLLTPGFLRTSSKEMEKYRLSITKAHRDLIELCLPNLADFMLYFFALNRIPEALKEEFQATLESHKVPTLEQLLGFLFEREIELKALESSVIGTDERILHNTETDEADFKARESNKSASGSSSQSCERLCHICCEPHTMCNCPTFLAFTVAERRSYMETYDYICRNCFDQLHRTSDCTSLACCKFCSKRHHNMLHPEPRLLCQNYGNGGMSQNRVKTLRDIEREIGLFRHGESPSSVSSSDGFLLSSPSSDS